MEKKILVDTDIIIKSYRGDAIKYKQLQAIETKFAISVVTALELLNGSRSIKHLQSTRKELKAYYILHFDIEISIIAYKLFNKYALDKNLQIPDSIIAATALKYNLLLYTDNKKDYDFIQGIQFYNEK